MTRRCDDISMVWISGVSVSVFDVGIGYQFGILVYRLTTSLDYSGIS